MKGKYVYWWSMAIIPMIIASCDKDNTTEAAASATITVENVLASKPLVESGTFQYEGGNHLIMPGNSVSFSFSAAKGQDLSFVTMYGWSNDIFFAPGNPGIQLYKTDGTPIEGDVSSQIKLWDNGTRINQTPGATLVHPGPVESISQNIQEIKNVDPEGNRFADASDLMKVSLKYDGNSTFTVTISNSSANTTNPTPFSPGVWSISYIAGTDLLDPNALYEAGKPTANGLTKLAEMGDNSELGTYITSQTGIFTPLSPVLVVVYNGIDNPLFKTGEKDPGHGLKDIAQKGDASVLATYLKTVPGVKSVYILAATNSTVLLPKIGDQPGSSVSQALKVDKGDKLAIATMYGFSNDWFFATDAKGIDAMVKGDVSSTISLYDDGTAINQFPGAGITQFNLAGTPLSESKVITQVPNPNKFTTLPDIKGIIKITLN